MTLQSDQCAKRNFIVNTDCTAKKVTLINPNSRTKNLPNIETEKFLDQGTLLEELITDRRERTNSLHRSRQIIVSILGSTRTVYYAVELNKVSNVGTEEAQLLLAIECPKTRMDIYNTRTDLINDAKSANVGSLVKVEIKPSVGNIGVVIFKDHYPLLGKGIFFGIKYLNHDKMIDWSDIQWKKTDCEIITSFSRLRFLKKNIEALSLGSKIQQLSSHASVKNAANEHLPLEVGERVVWLSDKGAEFGIVRWVGYLENSSDPVAGVDFENPVGTGTGCYNDEVLFSTKPNHASFVPIAGLMREKDFKPTSKHKISFSKSKKKKEKQIKASSFYDLDNSSTDYKPQHTHIKALESNALREAEKNSQLLEPKIAVFQDNNLSPKLQQSQCQQPDELKADNQLPHENRETHYQEQTKQEVHHPENLVENDIKVKEDVNSHQRQHSFPIHAHNEKFEASQIKTNHSEKSSKSPSLENFKNDEPSSKNSTISLSSTVSGSGSKVKNRHSVPSPVTQRRSSSSSSSIQEVNDACIVNSDRIAHSKNVIPDIHDELKTKSHASTLGINAKAQLERSNSPNYSAVCKTKPISPKSDLSKSNFKSEIVQQNNKSFLPTKEILPIEDGNSASLEAEHINSIYPLKNLHFEKEQEVNNFLLDPEQVGSVVEITVHGEPRYGVIKWIGHVDDSKRKVAGLEMDKELPNEHDDGSFGNRKYFSCAPGKGYFAALDQCRRDGRFIDSLQPITTQRTRSAVFGSIDCPAIIGDVPPLTYTKKLLSNFGKNKGIQGHHNSCYLDATLFSMFTFSSVFDSLLHRPRTAADIDMYEEVQKVLKEDIVNPLRQNLYVRADRVMKLRTLLEKLSSISGLTSEEKDPEEFLHSLLHQILKAEPFLKLNSGQEAYFYQLFVEKNEKLQVPTVQQLFDQSFLISDIKLKEIPSCLIIQMPRFGKQFKMYNRIFPSPVLDITDVLEDSPRQCTICGNIADFECRECFHALDPPFCIKSFCQSCVGRVHCHTERTGHNPRKIDVPEEFTRLPLSTVPHSQMDLFAVVCIETSHYVAFVKCGEKPDSPWCFFDSMADRKGEQNGYNIPEVISCPHLSEWLSLDNLHELLADQEVQLPELAKRLFSDAYMCMYQSSSVMMYH